MIRRFSILFAFLPFALFGGVNEDLQSIVDRGVAHCTNCIYLIDQAGIEVATAQNYLARIVVDSTSSDSFDHKYNARLYLEQARNTLHQARSAADNARRAFWEIEDMLPLPEPVVTNINVTVVTNITVVENVQTNLVIEVCTNCCEDCCRKLDSVLYLLDEGFSGTSDSLDTISSDVQALRLSVNQISNMLQNAGCDCAPYLTQILAVLNQMHSVLSSLNGTISSWDVDLRRFLNFYNSLQTEIEDYYKLLNRRYSDFDSRLPQALSQAFQITLQRINDITSSSLLDTWSPSGAVDAMLENISGVDNFELSNEGYIGLYSAALQERSYLTQVKQYEFLTNQLFSAVASSSSSNAVNVDLSWFSNYLDRVQRPYYELWNKFNERYVYAQLDPYHDPTRWNYVSNFFTRAYPPNSRQGRTAYMNFHNNYTNWFERVEYYLMNLNGLLIPTDSLSDYSSSDTSSMNDTIESATNDINEVVGKFSNYSNGFYLVVGAFTNCLHAFEIEVNQANDRIRLFDGGTYFQTTWNPIEIDYTTLEDITEPVRKICIFLWVVSSSFAGFLFFVYFCGLVVRVVARFVSMISSYMSPS